MAIYSNKINVIATSRSIPSLRLMITNTQNVNTPAGLQVLATVPLTFGKYSVDFDKIAFYYNGNPVYSWVESISNGNMNVWLKIPVSIPANTSITINAMPNIETVFDNKYWGCAPTLTSQYGQYDNGTKVFNFYDNFAGTVLSSVWVVPKGSNYIVNNGFIATPSSGSTTAVYNPSIQEISSIIAEWGLNMSSTTYSNVFSYFQLNRYSGYSNLQQIGIAGSDALLNNNNLVTTVSIPSTGVQVFGVWNGGTTVTWYYPPYKSYTYSSATAKTDYLSLGWAYNGQSYNFPTIYYVRTRAYPPNGVMPSITVSY